MFLRYLLKCLPLDFLLVIPVLTGGAGPGLVLLAHGRGRGLRAG
ncbi:MAG: hypothetical protein ACR5K7_05765 [Symbiopectobacterium sp.]